MAGIEGPQDEHNMVHTTPQEQPQTPDTEDNSVSAEKKKCKLTIHGRWICHWVEFPYAYPIWHENGVCTSNTSNTQHFIELPQV